MKRVPLRRRTPLTVGSPLPRGNGPRQGGSLTRRVPLKERATPKAGSQATRNSGPTPAVRALVLERDGYMCVCCGKSIIGQRYSLAHRKRASQGGKPVPENLLTLLGWGAEAHHGRVDLYKDPADEVKGYRLDSQQDPASVPVAYKTPDGFAVWWLLPDGTRSAERPEGTDAA